MIWVESFFTREIVELGILLWQLGSSVLKRRLAESGWSREKQSCHPPPLYFAKWLRWSSCSASMYGWLGYTQCIIYTTGYTTVHNIHPLSKPLTPSCVLSSVVFQHKSSKSQHFTSSPSRVVTTNEGPQKSKANLWLRNCTAPESS